MASEKQIAANRANAKKSTGPKTAAGKRKSSQNAYRHGLSSPLRLDSSATSAKADSLVRMLVGESANEIRLRSAIEFAHAQLELKRIRTVQEELTATFDVDQAAVRTLRRMASLDRYERYASTKRRQALRKL